MNNLTVWVNENLLISSLIIFVVIYVVLHFNKLTSNDCFYGDYNRTLLWTAIVLLIIVCYLSISNNELKIFNKKYKVVNNNSLDDIFIK